MATATTEGPRNLRGTSLADRICEYLNGAYRGRHASKRLAIDADVSDRTAENWRRRLNGPDAERLVRLMAVHPGLQRQINDDVALLRRVLQSQQQARECLHETNDRHDAAADRAGNALGFGLDQ